MPKRFQSNTPSSVQFRLSDLQALLLDQPRLCSLQHRSPVLRVIDGLVEREFLARGSHPHFLTRTPAGEAALLLFKHFGGVIADEDRLR
jgi:hypothetical protein